jgi:hypothetical protein
MKDLNINIGGPSGRARQQVSFKIAQACERPTLDPREISHLVAQLRVALEQSRLEGDELRRAERHLATIEEEAASAQPATAEIGHALSYLNGLLQAADKLAPLFSNTLGLLARAVGIAA